LKEPAAKAFAADVSDHVEVSADHQLRPSPGQPDIEVLAGTFGVADAVDGQHYGGALEALEAEDMAVEDVFLGQELVSVRRPAAELDLVDLLAVASAGAQ